MIAPTYLPPLKFSAAEADFVAANFSGRKLTPVTVATLDAGLGEQGASLLHFICHGSSGTTAQTLKLDPDDTLTDVQLEGLPGLARVCAERHPFVFLNACSVGQTIPALVGSSGFAAVFTQLGARAVIAPLWDVRDAVAALVARRFYQAIIADPALPFAEAVRRIRRDAYEGIEPEDSYAAYCFYGDPNRALVREG